MAKKGHGNLILAVAVALILLASLFGGLKSITGGSGSSQISHAWIDQQLPLYNTTGPYTGATAAVMTRAGYSAIFSLAPSVAASELAMLLSTGAGNIRVDISFDPWLQNNATAMTQYDAIVTAIKLSGHGLIIADAAADSYRNNKQSWSAFQTEWIQRVTTLSERYHPTAYVVVKEPSYYFPMIQGSPFSVPSGQDFGNLSQRLADAVRAASPGTKVGFSAHGDLYHLSRSVEADAMKYVATRTNLDFIGFDIYTTGGFADTAQFLSSVGANGKAVWIAEAWSGTAPSVFDPSRSSLDVSWMRLLDYYAAHIGASQVIPFYTDIYSGYSIPSTTSGLLSFYQQRSPVFYEFQNVVKGNP